MSLKVVYNGPSGEGSFTGRLKCTSQFMQQFQAMSPIWQDIIHQSLVRVNNGQTQFPVNSEMVTLSVHTKSGYHNLRAIEMPFGRRIVVQEKDGFYSPVAVFKSHEQYDDYLDNLRAKRPPKKTNFTAALDTDFALNVDSEKVTVRQGTALARLITQDAHNSGVLPRHDQIDFAAIAAAQMRQNAMAGVHARAA